MIKKTFSLLTLAIAALIGAQAATVTVTQGSLAQTRAAEAAFLNGKVGVITETFEGFSVGNGRGNGFYSDPVNTAVGQFDLLVAGSGGSCLNCSKLAVLDSDTTTFGGRFNTTVRGKNWLDSNDATKIHLDFSASVLPVYNFGFFLMDPNDAGGRLRVKFSNNASQDLLFGSGNSNGGALPNGSLYYIAFEGGGPYHAPGLSVNSLEFLVRRPNSTSASNADGFGIDNLSVASSPVPEPSTYMLIGSGLMLAGLIRRRTSRS